MPELAVFDAYRAGIVANQMREDEKSGLSRFQAATTFLRAERLAVDHAEAWTSERRRFVLGGWAYSALSTIVINDIPELEYPKGEKCALFSINKRQVVCMALEIRAIYRLCGALYMCGGGAQSDALGLIDDAHKRCTGMEDWEKTYFQMLGNEILDNCMKPWDEGMNDPQGLAFLSLTEQLRRDEERRTTKESMLTKTTKLKISRYFWNIYEPEVDNAEWQKLLRSWVSQTTDNCSPHFIDTNDIWDETSKPFVELRADRDINAGELVLSERTRSNVTTSIPEDVVENPNLPPSRRYYCDTCSCLMIVPQDCPVNYNDPKTPVLAAQPLSHHSASPTISLCSSRDSANAAYGSDNFDYATDPMIFAQQRASPSQTPVVPPDTPTPHPSPTSPAPPDFTLCALTHTIPICSPTCLTLRSPLDNPVHRERLERDLRSDHLLLPPTPKRLEEKKRQCLIDLLLLRILANALETDIHPLQDRDLLFATSGAGCRMARKDGAEGERIWSFTDDVVRPIYYLERVMEELGVDQWVRLEACDGWVLTDLKSKIDMAMRMSEGPVCAKVFDRAGVLERVVCSRDLGWNDLVTRGGESVMVEGGGDVETWNVSGSWIGSIHPIFNMIRVADPAKGERPNVAVVRREGVLCYAIGGGRGEPAIKAGEALVRAEDGVVGLGMGFGTRLGREEGGGVEGRGREERGEGMDMDVD